MGDHPAQAIAAVVEKSGHHSYKGPLFANQAIEHEAGGNDDDRRSDDPPAGEQDENNPHPRHDDIEPGIRAGPQLGRFEVDDEIPDHRDKGGCKNKINGIHLVAVGIFGRRVHDVRKADGESQVDIPQNLLGDHAR